jgi:hypothetical protein
LAESTEKIEHAISSIVLPEIEEVAD